MEMRMMVRRFEVPRWELGWVSILLAYWWDHTSMSGQGQVESAPTLRSSGQAHASVLLEFDTQRWLGYARLLKFQEIVF
jgi:hypothetical protein